MSEMDEFEAFFGKMGVRYTKNFGGESVCNEVGEVETGKDILSVAQCHFHFVEGVFIGTEEDETGCFYDRIKGRKER